MKTTSACSLFFSLSLLSAAHAQYAASLWGTGNYTAGPYSATGGLSCATGAGYSVAFGYQSGTGSQPYGGIAMGANCWSYGNWSLAMGSGSVAYDSYTIALGSGAAAGTSSTSTDAANCVAIGPSSLATGTASVAIGHGAESKALQSVAVGPYPIARGNGTTWVPTDPVFTVANGQSNVARSNALVVLKNGTVLIKASGDLSMGSFTAGIKPDDAVVTP